MAPRVDRNEKVTSAISTGASKRLYQALPRTVTFWEESLLTLEQTEEPAWEGVVISSPQKYQSIAFGATKFTIQML